MTEKLYYSDSHLKTFSARVVSCEEAGDHYLVALDRTAFYPEGGGQPGDRGTLGSVRVLDTHERHGVILHSTDTPLTPGVTVTGEIDWERRFDHMQQHSGEHMVSGLICGHYGCDNVGFHMGKDVVTIDFNTDLTLAQLREVEKQANRLIWEDRAVEIGFYEGEELERIDYRSKKPLEGPVRIVTFSGADTCACCGTHVTRTGEIGCVRLLNVHPLRGGVRIEMLAGERAYRYFDVASDAAHTVAAALSVQEGQAPAALERLTEEYEALKYRSVRLEDRLFAAMARDMTGPQLLFEPGLTPDALRRLSLAVSGQTGEGCAAFSGSDNEGYKYALSVPGGAGELVKSLNTALSGRGGGKGELAQGSVPATQAQIKAFFEQLPAQP